MNYHLRQDINPHTVGRLLINRLLNLGLNVEAHGPLQFAIACLVDVHA